jgi:alkaline phosphatase
MNAFRPASFRGQQPAVLRLALLALLPLLILSAIRIQAENIILFIGDGMGFEQVKAANYYQGGAVSFEAFPSQADCTTFSADATITDSAAAGTAIATGVKVNNGIISLATPGDGRELETLLEFHQKRGKKVGLITTAYLTHATPAVFAAHTASRNHTSEIGYQYLNRTRPNILFGGGGYGLDSASTTSAGYTVVTDSAGFDALNLAQDHLAALFGNGYLPYEATYLGQPYPVPHLTEMVSKALEALASHPDGFFLMVEAARIDHACHDNRLPETVHETLELSRAVEAALTWVGERTDTTIIVTSDHETGGLTVVKDNGPGYYPTVTWSTGGHTAAKVPVYAWGRNADLVSGTIDNTDFFDLLTAENSTSPVLSRVASTVLDETAVQITWTTDIPATSTVEYRVGSEENWTLVSDDNWVTQHALLLTGLAADQLHHYRVTSATTSASATSATYTFLPSSQPVPGTLIASGSVWKYDDSGTDLGSAWRETGYPDDSWAFGPAVLGYGETWIDTLLSYGDDSNQKHICYYFRREFTVDDPAAYDNLSLSILRDDGAVVYLNGTEIARYNMPSGEITYQTTASTASDFPWDPALLVPNLLVAGKNVLAVEVHQANAGSSDVLFDLELTAERLEPDITPPILSQFALAEVTDRSAIITWTTDEPADSRVDYGTTEEFDSWMHTSAWVTFHTVELTGLTPNTTYNYQARSSDLSGNAGYGPELSLTTLRLNQPPVAYDLDVSTLEDTPVSVTLSAIDADNQTLSYRVTEGPLHGTLTGTAPGLTYTPAPDYHGADQFQFVANDGLDDSSPATVSITVLPVNDPPTAPVLTATAGDAVVHLAWTASIDPDGTPVTYEVFRAFGSLEYKTLTTTDLLAYTDLPVVNETSYHYYVRALDAYDNLHTDSEPVVVTPQAIDYNAYVVQNPTVTYGVVTGDYTALHPWVDDTQTLTERKVGLTGRLDVQYQLHTLADPTQIREMTLRLDAWFQPWDDDWLIQLWTGTTWTDVTADVVDSGSLAVTDPRACVDPDGFVHVRFLDSAAIRREEFDSLHLNALHAEIRVGPSLNRAPIASDDTASTVVNESVRIDLLANDSDPDDDPIRISTLPHNSSQGAALWDHKDGTVTYTPLSDFSGTDTFDYTISDGALTATATVTVTVTANEVNHPPSAPVLTATAGDAVVQLVWTASMDPDGTAVTYEIYRAGASSDYTSLAFTSDLTYTDETVENNVTYDYLVRAWDGGNLYADSNPFSATPQASSGTDNTVRVAWIDLRLTPAGRNWKAEALVTIVDTHGNPAANATVLGDWFFDDAPIQSNATATTDNAGIAGFISPPVKTNSGTFTFVVVDVQLGDASYLSEKNEVTSASISVP